MLTYDSRASARAVIRNEDGIILISMRSHSLQSPHAYTIRTSQDNVIAVALFEFFLNEGANGL